MDLPGNSHRERAQKTPGKAKDVKKIVEGDVQRRKKPLGKRFSETFLGGDAKGVGQYVMLDVLLPALRDMVSDAISTGIDQVLYGGRETWGGSSRGRSSSRPSSGLGHVSYNRYSSSPASRPDPRESGMSRRARQTHNFDEIILDNRAAAEEVIDTLVSLIEEHEEATVGDLYNLVGVEPTFADEKWGWLAHHVRDFGVSRSRGSFILNLPKPEHLE